MPVLVAASLVEAEPFRWIALVVDLTEQKRAEQQASEVSNQLDAALRDADAAQALAAMARELEAAQRLAQVGSWQWICATDENTWSREMFRIHGIDEPTDPLTSEEWLAFLHPDDRATHVDQRTAAVEHGAPDGLREAHRAARRVGAAGGRAGASRSSTRTAAWSACGAPARTSPSSDGPRPT